MGPLNIQPYVAACQRLYSFVSPVPDAARARQTLTASENFLVAVTAFEAAVAPEHIGAFPEDKRSDIRKLAETIRGFDPTGRVSDFVAAAAVQELQRKGVLPNDAILQQKDDAKRRNAIAEFMNALLKGGDAPAATAGALQLHEDPRQSLRYVADRQIQGAIQAAAPGEPAPIPLDETSFESEEDVPPLVLPGSDILLIRGGRYVGEHKGIERSVNPAPYRLQFPPIARGGNSHVYLAQETSLKDLGLNEEIGTNRKVAVKIVAFSDQAQRDNVLRLFQKEIEYQSLFQSDRFVRVYAAGLTAQGNPFLVMEYCEGGTLASLIRGLNAREPFDLKRAMEIARQVVAAVAEAHDAGIVHRDIKPHNFLVTSKGDVKLGDCGLAEREDLLPRHATPNDVVGTPGYIPPESAAHGWAGGKRGDIFALGVTLYELFSGVFCFQADNGVEMMKASVNRKPPSPASLHPRRGIPKVVDRILLKCLEKDAAKRYPDAGALLYDLLTAEASELIERAEEARRQTKDSNVKIVTNDATWAQLIQEALRRLREVYDQFPHPKILLQRLRLNFALYVWGKKRGDEETLRRTADSLELLSQGLADENRRETERRLGADAAAHWERENSDAERALEEILDEAGPDGSLLAKAQAHILDFIARSPSVLRESLSDRLEGAKAAAFTRRRLHVHLNADPALRGARARVEIIRESSTAGFIEFEKRFAQREGFADPRFVLERGPYVLRVVAPGAIPLNLPLPVRPGHYEIRAPFYTRRDVPETGAVIVPAGAVPAYTQDVSFSQLLDESAWRFMTHDVAFLPLRTHRDWSRYLAEMAKTQGPEEAAKRMPSLWKTDGRRLLFPTEDDPLWESPVSHLPAAWVDEYLQHLSRALNLLPDYKLRLPRLDEWKAALRGVRPQRWPWGDATPVPGTVCFRFMNHSNPRERTVDLPSDAKFLDVSPYSFPEVDRALTHVASNVQKPLDVSDPDDRRRIAAVFGVEDEEAFFRDHIVVAGTSYRSPATTNPDILDYRRKDEAGDWGIMPVIQLKPAQALPSRESLKQ